MRFVADDRLVGACATQCADQAFDKPLLQRRFRRGRSVARGHGPEHKAGHWRVMTPRIAAPYCKPHRDRFAQISFSNAATGRIERESQNGQRH